MPCATVDLSRELSLHSPEEVAQLERRGFGSIRSVGSVVVDRGAEVLAQRARLRLGRIGRAHQVAPLLDGAVGFEAHHDARARRHEIRQAAEKRPRLVDVVEAFGLRLGHVNHAHARGR